MKATIQIDMQALLPSEARRILLETCEKWKSEGLVAEYHFEIDTPDGAVTEKCVLDNEQVIA